MNKLKHFKARHKRNGKYAEFAFYSMKQAQLINPDFTDWVEIVR